MPPSAEASRPNSPEARDKAFVVHGLTNLRRHLDEGPLVIESGSGVWVRDRHGRDYLEGMSGLWCLSLGYGETRLIEACRRQMETLAYAHLTNHRSHPAVIDLAEKLIEIAPVPMSHVWFANSGSEAADCAARLCWYYWNAQDAPERRKFLTHRRAYHGNTIAAASLTGADYAHRQFNLPLDGFLHVACPDYVTDALEDESEQAFSERLLADLEALIAHEGPETIAAFFTEPILAAGGVVIPPRAYLDGLQVLLRKHGILLVADEVVTAFGRTGEMFGCTTMGLAPDLIVCAKGITSAYFPLSAVLINARVFDAMVAQSERLPLFGLTMTYSGHPVGCAVAREAIRIYEDDAIVARVRRLEPVLLDTLRHALRGSAIVGDIRGRGLLAGVQLMKSRLPAQAFDPAQRVGPLCADAAQAHGLFVRAIGDTLAICPPLTISESEIEILADRLARGIADVEKDL